MALSTPPLKSLTQKHSDLILIQNKCHVFFLTRCHQNDLENIIPFAVIGLLYSLTGPDLSTALIHFRVFAVARICHTVAYVMPLPQPSRALTWMAGMVVTLSMAYRVLTTARYL